MNEFNQTSAAESSLQHADEFREGIEAGIQGLKYLLGIQKEGQIEKWRKKIREGWEEHEIIKRLHWNKPIYTFTVSFRSI